MWATHAEQTHHNGYYHSNQELTLLREKQVAKPGIWSFMLSIGQSRAVANQPLGPKLKNSLFHMWRKDEFCLLTLAVLVSSQTQKWASRNWLDTQRSFNATAPPPHTLVFHSIGIHLCVMLWCERDDFFKNFLHMQNHFSLRTLIQSRPHHNAASKDFQC